MSSLSKSGNLSSSSHRGGGGASIEAVMCFLLQSSWMRIMKISNIFMLPLPARHGSKVCVCMCSVMSDSMDCSPPGSSVHGILQARILENTMPSSRGLPDPGIEPLSPALQADSLLLSYWRSLLLTIGPDLGRVGYLTLLYKEPQWGLKSPWELSG